MNDLREVLREASRRLERIAFAIPPPNIHTPELVMLAQMMRSAADQPSAMPMWKLHHVGGRWPYWQCRTPDGPYQFQADTEEAAEAFIAKMRAAYERVAQRAADPTDGAA